MAVGTPASSPQLHGPLSTVGILIYGLARPTHAHTTHLVESRKSQQSELLVELKRSIMDSLSLMALLPSKPVVHEQTGSNQHRK